MAIAEAPVNGLKSKLGTMKIVSVILFGAMFVFMFWLFDIHGVQVLWKQHQAESFPSTKGKVLSNRVTVTYGSKGSVHYHVSISYNYFVKGQTYWGDRYRYDGHPGSQNLANAIVSEHPAGSEVEVFYDPWNPADSVLSTGVDPQDVYFLFLTTPLCLLLFGMLIKALQQMDWGGPPRAGGVKLISEMLITRARLPRVQPMTVGLAALGGFSFMAGLLMAMGLVSGPPLMVGGGALVCVLSAGAAVFGWQYWNVHSGRQDLVIDEGSRTIQLPLTYKRRAQTPMPFSEVEAVTLEKVRHQSKGGVYYTYLVTLEMKDGSAQILVNMKQARAEAFAAWLKEKFGLSGVAPIKESALSGR